MSNRFQELIRRRLHALSIRRWKRAVLRADKTSLGDLKQLRAQANQMRQQVDKFNHIADGRLTLPRIGTNAIRKPAQTDWSYRPEIWRGPITPFGIAAIQTKTPIGTAAKLYHDCHTSEMTIRQVRNTRESDLAPFGLRVDVFRFDGSFLSLTLELPESAVDGLRSNHIITLSAEVESEKPLEIFARLNIKYGPNVEQVVRELPLSKKETLVEFDLAHTNISERRLQKIWMDLIFEGPELNEINLRDVTFSRRPRADF